MKKLLFVLISISFLQATAHVEESLEGFVTDDNCSVTSSIVSHSETAVLPQVPTDEKNETSKDAHHCEFSHINIFSVESFSSAHNEFVYTANFSYQFLYASPQVGELFRPPIA